MRDPEPPFPVEELGRPEPGARVERRRSERRARRDTGRRRALRWAARLLVLAVVFLAGLVIGRALEDAPRPGGEQTIVNTLRVPTEAPLTRAGTGP
jgi:hypothetical protein